MPGIPLLLAAATGEDAPLDLPTTTTRHLDAVGSGSSSLVRTIVGLAVVIAVIYGVAWILRQVKTARDEQTRGSGLSSAATIALGPNRSLHLVRAGRELVLVGVAESGVTPIRTYTEDEALSLGLIDEPDDGDDDAPGARPRPAAPKAQVLGNALAERLRRMTAR